MYQLNDAKRYPLVSTSNPSETFIVYRYSSIGTTNVLLMSVS